MTSIFELLLQLPTVTDASITCFSKNPVLYPMKEVVHNLQLTYYWWSEANNELNEYKGEELHEEGQKRSMVQPPTLIGANEQLAYIQSSLRTLGKQTQDFLEDAALPDGVKYKVAQGYNKVMEAVFNADISTKYYEEYSRIRAREQRIN